MLILGLAGPARSGKDSVADYLVRRFGFIKFAFSDALYRETQQAFGLEDQSLLRDAATKEVPTERLALKHCSDHSFVEIARRIIADENPDTFFVLENVELSPRWVLQVWGTEYRRAQNPRYWLDQCDDFLSAMRRTARYPEQAPQYFVNTAVRFENEQEWIHEYAGNVWHLHRDGLAGVNQHVSETALPVLDGERELWNNGSIDYLHQGIDLLMTSSARVVRVEPPLPMEEQGKTDEENATL